MDGNVVHFDELFDMGPVLIEAELPGPCREIQVDPVELPQNEPMVERFGS